MAEENPDERVPDEEEDMEENENRENGNGNESDEDVIDENEADSVFESEGDLEEIMNAMEEVKDEEELLMDAIESGEMQEVIVDRDAYLNINLDDEVTHQELGDDSDFIASLNELRRPVVIEDRLAFTMARSDYLNRDIGHEESVSYTHLTLPTN